MPAYKKARLFVPCCCSSTHTVNPACVHLKRSPRMSTLSSVTCGPRARRYTQLDRYAHVHASPATRTTPNCTHASPQRHAPSGAPFGSCSACARSAGAPISLATVFAEPFPPLPPFRCICSGIRAASDSQRLCQQRSSSSSPHA